MKRWQSAAAPAYLGVCLLLGGASAGGLAANMVLQVLALAMICWALCSSRKMLPSKQAVVPLAFGGCAFAIVLVQLISLPPGLWGLLPGRDATLAGFAMLEQPLPWLPVSLSPSSTVASFLWLLPAIAVLLGILLLGAYRPVIVAAVIVAMTILSVIVGAIQIAGGPQSAAYFYDPTNRGIAVGLFANGNHFATMLVVCLPFVAALYTHAARRADRRMIATVGMVSVVTVIIVLIGIAINGSLAGIGLVVPVAFASLMILRWKRLPRPRVMIVVLAVATGVTATAIFFGPFDNNLFSLKAASNQQSRATVFTLTLEAIRDFAPVGSGLGTFVPIYRTYEAPELIDRFFMNNAHNDYLQLALETGAPGMLLVAAGVAWLIARGVAIWRDDATGPFERAATIAIAAILIHSAVDYPLRTAAISAVFAACVALMAKPRPYSRRQPDADEQRGVHLSAG